MSVKLIGEVWSLELDHPEQSVLLALADHAADDGTHCFPSVHYTAWKTGYSVRSVQRVLANLREMKLIIPVGRPPAPGRTQEYKLVLSNGVPKPPYEPPIWGRVPSQSEPPDDDPPSDANPTLQTDAKMAGVDKSDANSRQETHARMAQVRSTHVTRDVGTDDTGVVDPRHPRRQRTTPVAQTDAIAMSPQPSLTAKESVREPSEEAPGKTSQKLGGKSGRQLQPPSTAASRHSVFPGLSKDEDPRGPPASAEPHPADDRPNPYKFFEENVSRLTPFMVEVIKEAEVHYSTDWVMDALKEAVLCERRSWAYAEAILKRWEREGKDDGRKGSNGKSRGHPEENPWEATQRQLEQHARDMEQWRQSAGGGV